MSIVYYKRFRMEIYLERAPNPIELPAGFRWIPWDESTIDWHAHVKYRCFSKELDAQIFPCLGDRIGCRRLMREISNRRGFLPQATWLLADDDTYVGTVQGVIDGYQIGMIQNLGIIPEYRGQGLGSNLLLKALDGFRQVGLERGMLEVTADNLGAVRLYRRMGFKRSKTVFKAVESS
jgi:ribosomal protein S18 acetylase RimI-like enzyme